MLTRQIVRAVMPGLPDDSELSGLVSEAIMAFVDAEGSCALASQRVEASMRDLGGRLAEANTPPDRVNEAFDSIHAAVQRGLQMTLGSSVSGHVVLRLREGIAAYLAQLQVHLNHGWTERQRAGALRAEQLKHLHATIFRGGSRLDHALELSGLDPTDEFTALVSVRDPLPPRIRHDPDVLAGNDLREALVPAAAGWSAHLREHVTRQVVVGPPAGLQRIAESLELTRRAALLLRESTAHDDRTIVPCTDLLGPLLLGGNRYLAELLVTKHLGSLSALGPERRVHLGEMLLVWLETGQPVAAVARALGLAPQTAHSRAQALRKIFGDDLDDPSSRLELILALRAVLPEWSSLPRP
ncbi:helix-turn-helix domain-containing protein [Mumia quercus]|uniref:PucR family transcriptional regulator n=1 Tax=Mumia quercus TaxID=2976125 RepID=UPI0021CF38D6|nr:helix-turn-helix domain-containing protein [Mumia quercus]